MRQRALDAAPRYHAFVPLSHGTRADGPASGPVVVDSTKRADSELDKKTGNLVCVRCHHRITSYDRATEVRGRFEHEATNPHGFHFRLGCFVDAAGAVVRGQSSTFYSWFPGYSWRVSDCGLCDTHIGWLFERAGGQFFALVLDRLRDEAES